MTLVIVDSILTIKHRNITAHETILALRAA